MELGGLGRGPEPGSGAAQGQVYPRGVAQVPPPLLPPARHGHRPGDLRRLRAGQAGAQLQVHAGGAAGGQPADQNLRQCGGGNKAKVLRRRAPACS